MSTGLIIVIVVVVLILVVLAVMLPRMRGAARVRAREHELDQRRDQAAGEHHEAADAREQRAQAAEQKARIAEQQAAKERAEANLHEERATMHERGLADQDLVGDEERDRFAGTSAVEDDRDGSGRGREDGTADASRPERAADEQTGSDSTGARPVSGDSREGVRPARAGEPVIDPEVRRDG